LEDELPIKLESLDIDAVYENFVRQIAGDQLQDAVAGETTSLKESVERSEQIEKLKTDIQKLQAKIRKEKQLNRQMQMNAELKNLKAELEELNYRLSES